MNTLYYGDNLDILPKYIPDASVDLIYLDPPFNSKRDYNVIFKDKSGRGSAAQSSSFEDTWHWQGAAEPWSRFHDLCPCPKTIELMQGFHSTIGENDVMAYLVMMAPRLLQLRRVLKSTGSIYLHCDPAASHYLKIVMDTIFGTRFFRNEIVWLRHESHSDAHQFGRLHDVLLYYSRTDDRTFHPVRIAYSAAQMRRYRADADGRLYRAENLTGAGVTEERTVEWRGVHPGVSRHWMWSIDYMEQLVGEGRILFQADGRPRKDGYKAYLDNMQGKAVGDVWTDVPRIPNTSSERLHYPTQKPLALLRRILAASSNPGDAVLDPFCGCGTAIVAAQELGRPWIGIDITPVAASLIQERLAKMGARDTDLVAPDDSAKAIAFNVVGLPKDVAGAEALFAKNPKHFEMWADGLVPAMPNEKKGADKGIDGMFYVEVGEKKPVKGVVQVKGGHVKRGDIATLRGDMQREQAALGFLVCLQKPSAPMLSEATSAGPYAPPAGGHKVPSIQIRTIKNLLDRQPFDFPFAGGNVTFDKPAVQALATGQGDLGI